MQEIDFRHTMEKSLQTQLELLKAKVSPQVLMESCRKNGKILNKTVDEQALKDYRAVSLLENRE